MNAAGVLVLVLLPLEDLERFPPPSEVAARVDWCDRHIEWIEAQAALDLVYPEYWFAWYNDARAARQPWYELRLAQNQTCGDAWRQRRLKDLHDLIGAEAYRSGRMPTHLPPLWRFQRTGD